MVFIEGEEYLHFSCVQADSGQPHVDVAQSPGSGMAVGEMTQEKALCSTQTEFPPLLEVRSNSHPRAA